ncbi:MAG: GTPase Era [Alphaproteobacteria bacterium]
MTKFGFVTLMGVPNAGKSTLLNALLGEKLSIVCHKRQTTRTRVAGILTKKETQAVLIDTPGIFFDAKGRLEKSMVSTAWQATTEAHIILLIADAHIPHFLEDTKKIMERLKNVEEKVVLVLNKTDLLKNKSALLEITQDLTSSFKFKNVFMISAHKKRGLDKVEQFILDSLPDGPWMYPEDQLSHLSERFLVAELTREVLLHQVHDEVPHGLAVLTEKWENFRNGDVKIFQQICVSRKSHKSIILGQQGNKIKAIGEIARKEISKALGCTVHLFLHVKVDEKWQEKPDFYEELGIDLN